MTTFSKFVRPGTPKRSAISDRDLDIIEVILRYRFSPTSELVRLVGGNENVTLRRLRSLWESDVINRFAFPGFRTHSEFIYYLDRPAALDVLAQHRRVAEIHPDMEEEIKLNREADYAGAASRGQHMKLGFLQHSLVVSRLHYMLEMASRGSDGSLELLQWRQGAELRGSKVEVPEILSRRVEGTNEYVWEEHDHRKYRLPVEPDGLFSLRFEDGRTSHFCYEADRGSMPMADMLKKFRAYYHFIKRQQKHKAAFGVHPIRAVLVETTDEARARKLMELVEHAAVIGEGKRSALFWFSISPLFTDVAEESAVARYLDQPSLLLEPVWALPDRSLHRLSDQENTPVV